MDSKARHMGGWLHIYWKKLAYKVHSFSSNPCCSRFNCNLSKLQIWILHSPWSKPPIISGEFPPLFPIEKYLNPWVWPSERTQTNLPKADLLSSQLNYLSSHPEGSRCIMCAQTHRLVWSGQNLNPDDFWWPRFVPSCNDSDIIAMRGVGVTSASHLGTTQFLLSCSLCFY